MEKIPVGLAIALVYGEFMKNCTDTLKKISDIGYKGIEPTAESPIPLNEYVKVLKDLDLAVTSTHVVLSEIEDDFNRVLEFNQAVGCKNIVVPCLDEEKPDEEYFHKFAYRLDKAGEKCRENGIKLCFHNHHIEFEKYNGKYGWDIIFDETSEKNVYAELDTCWATYAGVDAAEYVKKYRSRLPLIHFKDLDSVERDVIEIGRGVVDFKAVMNAVDPEVLEWILVEQDSSKLPPFESLKVSFDNLKKIGIA